jgi:Cft2 family RNA processing exonuclease
MKNEVSIKFLWGVEVREKWVSLTGSSILTTVDLWNSKVKILTDIGMFQWWQKDDEYNKQIDERAVKADYVIITHAHMDHIGRLALLVKKWFKWKIIMTSLTKDLVPLMLEDYVTLTRNKIEEQEEMKKRRWSQLKDYLKAVKLDEELKTNKDLKKADKTTKIRILNWLKWSFSSVEEFIKYAKIELAKKDILKESDIAEAIESREIELLYDEDDIKKTMSMIETLEFWDEMDLDNRMIISSLDDENIDKIPELIKWGYNKQIYVLPILKQAIINRWKRVLEDINKTNKENKNLREKLSDALAFVNDKKNKTSDSFKEKQSFLDSHNVHNKADIEAIKELCLLFPYSKEDIKLFSSFLEPVFTKPNQKVIESFKLRFFEAGHIAWSVQAQVTIVTKQVEHTLNQSNYIPTFKRSFNNTLYSWDLWKITKPNLSGSPFPSPHKIDTWIFESTYATREHPDKYVEFDKLIDLLNSIKWKKVIHTFSLDREQEVEFMLLKNKEDNSDKFPQFKAFREGIKPLKQRFKLLEKIDNPTEAEIKAKINLAEAISVMNAKIAEAQKWIYTGNIIVDSPLATKIKKVYLKHMPEKYYLLDPEVQTEIFWQEITRTLDKWEYKEILSPERIKSRDTIIVWWWMAQWWSWIPYLKVLLEDKDSRVFFTWYQAEWTLWHDLVSWKKQVIIEDKVYNVQCQIFQIWWFSAHPSHSDTVKYITKDLTFAKSAKIILTHWWENRKFLASDIEKEISWKVKVLISGLWDEITSKI